MDGADHGGDGYARKEDTKAVYSACATMRSTCRQDMLKICML